MGKRWWMWLGIWAGFAALAAFGPLTWVVQLLVARGATDWTMHTLLLVPIGVVAIVFFRLIVGLETFGLFAPLILSFTFHRISALLGVLLFVGLLAIVSPIGMLLSRFPLLSTARTAVLLVVSSLALLLFVAISPDLGARLSLVDIGMPVVAMSGMMDRFVSAQIDQSPHEAVKLSINTLLVSYLVAAVVLGMEPLRLWVTAHPDVLLAAIPLCLMMGRYTGLRLNEMWRFRVLSGR